MRAALPAPQEDPSFGFARDEETNQTVIQGMGEWVQPASACTSGKHAHGATKTSQSCMCQASPACVMGPRLASPACVMGKPGSACTVILSKTQLYSSSTVQMAYSVGAPVS